MVVNQQQQQQQQQAMTTQQQLQQARDYLTTLQADRAESCADLEQEAELFRSSPSTEEQERRFRLIYHLVRYQVRQEKTTKALCAAAVLLHTRHDLHAAKRLAWFRARCWTTRRSVERRFLSCGSPAVASSQRTMFRCFDWHSNQHLHLLARLDLAQCLVFAANLFTGCTRRRGSARK